jgi:hypothetical protein
MTGLGNAAPQHPMREERRVWAEGVDVADLMLFQILIVY